MASIAVSKGWSSLQPQDMLPPGKQQERMRKEGEKKQEIWGDGSVVRSTCPASVSPWVQIPSKPRKGVAGKVLVQCGLCPKAKRQKETGKDIQWPALAFMYEHIHRQTYTPIYSHVCTKHILYTQYIQTQTYTHAHMHSPRNRHEKREGSSASSVTDTCVVFSR